jgi:SAM-dependent methyltransferase
MSNLEKLSPGGNPKESEGYLSQIANNSDEKIGDLANAIINNQLPRFSDGRIKILELGTGGGQSIESLKKTLRDVQNVDIFATDISVSILRKIQNGQRVTSIAADAMKLPFKKNSLSAVNASAIFHEISSYGPFGNELETDIEKPYGREAVKRAFVEIHKALMPEGLLVYRDIFCPDGMFEEETAIYHDKAWVLFARWFYPSFLEANARVFPQDGQPEIREDDVSMKLTATKHLHRELQRHYLMLRDYLRTQLAANIGLGVIKEEWKEEGIKIHEFLARGILYQLISHGEMGDEYGKYIIQSGEYDKLFDRLIEQLLKQESNSVSSLEIELSGWKKREGKEVYTYASIGDMLSLACDAAAIVKDGHVLFPRAESDIKVIPRDYYNRYLREAIDNPEFDGKQIVRFFKVSPQEALESLKSLENRQWIVGVSEIRQKLEALI